MQVCYWYPSYVKLAGYAILASATACLYAITLLGVLAYRLSRGKSNDVKAPLQRTLLGSAIASLTGGLVVASWAARWQISPLYRMLLGGDLEDPAIQGAWMSVRLLVIVAVATSVGSVATRLAWRGFWNRRVLKALSVIFGAGLLLTAPGLARPGVEDPWVPVDFVILRSTADYSEARRVAAESAIQLRIPLDLRGLVHDEEHGLTWSKEVCAKDPLYPYPCYVARGRFDDGVYLSIERSDAYSDFAPGFFIVIAASGAPGSPELMKTVVAARSFYADAYTKQASVYVGCMH